MPYSDVAIIFTNNKYLADGCLSEKFEFIFEFVMNLSETDSQSAIKRQWRRCQYEIQS